MSVPANLTFTDIQTRVLNELRIPVTNVSEALKVANLINMVYRDIAAKQDWWWLTKKFPTWVSAARYPGNPDLTGVYAFPANLTLNVTHLSLQITLSEAPLVDLSGTALVVPGSGAPPFMNRVANGLSTQTTVNLDSIYLGQTSTAVTDYFFAYDYIENIADMNKAMRVTRYGYPYDLKPVGPAEMYHYKQFDLRRGPPEMWSVEGVPNVTPFSTASVVQSMPAGYSTALNPENTLYSSPFTQPYPKIIRVHPYPDKHYRMDVWYKQSLNTELSGTDLPLIPDDYRQVLVYGALARGYAVFLNDLDRSNFYQTLFNDMMALMSAQQKDYAKDQSGIQPRMHDYRRSNRRPRTAYSLGNWFDIFPSRP